MFFWTVALRFLSPWLIQEASEVLADPDGRWFSFDITGTDFMILEGKGLPTHLQALECKDTPIMLQALVNDLEDHGEAWVNTWLVPFQRWLGTFIDYAGYFR